VRGGGGARGAAKSMPRASSQGHALCLEDEGDNGRRFFFARWKDHGSGHADSVEIKILWADLLNSLTWLESAWSEGLVSGWKGASPVECGNMFRT